MKKDGWIYDAYPENGQLTLWIKTKDSVLQLHDKFTVEIYATPRKRTISELAEIIASHPLVECASICSRYQRIDDNKKSEVIQIAAKPVNYRKLIWDLQSADICTLYNTDINPIQRYFFSKPFDTVGKANVEYDENFNVIRLDMLHDSNTPNLAVFEIKLEEGLENARKQVSDAQFQVLVVERDQRPAFYQLLRDQFRLGSSNWRMIPGKLIVDYENFRSYGMAGLDEKSKFAFLPIGTVATWGPSRTIDSRQCYEAMKHNILIPNTRAGTGKNVLTAKEVAYTDRGALILSPRVGLHENVAELDFESLFPNILVKHNISYETVTASGIDESRRGFLVDLAWKFVQRRLYFKHEKTRVEEKSKRWRECEQREALLKKLLVSLYGYTGSDLNRFGNVFAYREINRIGRETVIKAMNIAIREGYQIIYLDTDSIFIKRQNATLDDFQKLADIVTDSIRFQISVANHYRYLILLTQEADPEIEAARRFYGRLNDGRIYYRGIELRRRDYPIFIKQFQQQLLKVILNADRAEDVQNRQLTKAIKLTVQAIEELRSGSVPVNELVISKVLRMPVERYRSLFPHVTAAIQLRQKNRPLKTGDLVDYVYLDSTHPNPLNRVSPAEFAETYDVEKYAEMLLDVAESILGVFGFSRTQLGFQSRSRNFLDELRSERTREILMELENLQP